jgi:hypothetical protein
MFRNKWCLARLILLAKALFDTFFLEQALFDTCFLPKFITGLLLVQQKCVYPKAERKP